MAQIDYQTRMIEGMKKLDIPTETAKALLNREQEIGGSKKLLSQLVDLPTLMELILKDIFKKPLTGNSAIDYINKRMDTFYDNANIGRAFLSNPFFS